MTSESRLRSQLRTANEIGVIDFSYHFDLIADLQIGVAVGSSEERFFAMVATDQSPDMAFTDSLDGGLHVFLRLLDRSPSYHAHSMPEHKPNEINASEYSRL